MDASHANDSVRAESQPLARLVIMLMFVAVAASTVVWKQNGPGYRAQRLHINQIQLASKTRHVRGTETYSERDREREKKRERESERVRDRYNYNMKIRRDTIDGIDYRRRALGEQGYNVYGRPHFTRADYQDRLFVVSHLLSHCRT